jgi:hypothetical protein
LTLFVTPLKAPLALLVRFKVEAVMIAPLGNPLKGNFKYPLLSGAVTDDAHVILPSVFAEEVVYPVVLVAITGVIFKTEVCDGLVLPQKLLATTVMFPVPAPPAVAVILLVP